MLTRTGVINTTVPVSENQIAVINKYAFEVTETKGVWLVKDEIAFKKNALKDASKKGRYTGKTLDEALKQAVEVRKELDGEKPRTTAVEVDTKTPVEAAKPAKKGRVSKAAKPKAAKPKAEKPKTVAKKIHEKKESRWERAIKVLVVSPDINEAGLAKQGDMTLKSAKFLLLGWNTIVPALLASGWSKPEPKK